MLKYILFLIFCSILISCGYTKLIPANETEQKKSDSGNSINPGFVNYSKMKFNFDDYGYNPQNSNLILHLATEDIYGCSGYKILTEHSISGNEINVKIIGIVKPAGVCLAVMQPARSEIDLNNVIGDFKLNIFLKDTLNSYQVNITGNKVFVSGAESDYSEYSTNR